MPVRLSPTKHDSGEDLCQLTLLLLGIFWLSLPVWNCSSRGCISHPILFKVAVPLVPPPILTNTCYPATWRGRWKTKGLSFPSGSTVGLLWGEALPVRSHITGGSLPPDLSASLLLLSSGKTRAHRLRRGTAPAQLYHNYNPITQAKTQLQWELAH